MKAVHHVVAYLGGPENTIGLAVIVVLACLALALARWAVRMWSR